MIDKKNEVKNGDVVCYRDRNYRVGVSMTNTSIELVELSAPIRGVWVCRDEVRLVSHQNPAHN
jgi:hypothetical protein